jgi:hypothetical protein
MPYIWEGRLDSGGGTQLRKMKRIFAALALVAVMGAVAPAAHADAGGGPGSNNGCAGHQPPPPPGGGCGK